MLQNSELSAFLEERISLGMKSGLENIQAMLKFFGSPEKSFRSIHVVGTNGKGSTAYYLASLLARRKIKTGLFTSPHLISFQERIRVNGEFLSEEEVQSLFLKTRAQCEKQKATFFETMTLWAFLHFQERGIKWAILEAGLGGRLDSTREAKGEGAILTGISLDHTAILGNSKEEILVEKLGVLEDEKWLVSGEQDPLLQAKIREWAQEKKQDLNFISKQEGLNRSRTLALTVAEKLEPTSTENQKLELKYLQELPWVGRLQVLGKEQAEWVIDGAHNPEAVEYLVKWLRSRWPNQKFTFVFAVLQDKNFEWMIQQIKPLAKHVILPKISHPHCVSTDELQSYFKGIPTTKVNSVQDIKVDFQNHAPYICMGSLFLVGELVHILKFQYESLRAFRKLKPDKNEHLLRKKFTKLK